MINDCRCITMLEMTEHNYAESEPTTWPDINSQNQIYRMKLPGNIITKRIINDCRCIIMLEMTEYKYA